MCQVANKFCSKDCRVCYLEFAVMVSYAADEAHLQSDDVVIAGTLEALRHICKVHACTWKYLHSA